MPWVQFHFSVIIGVLMHLFFLKEERAKADAQVVMPDEGVKRPLWQNALYFASMVGILVFANWGKPAGDSGAWAVLYEYKWILTSIFSLALGIMLVAWFGVKAWKVVSAAVLVTAVSLVFPGEPLVPFIVGIIALSIITNTETAETTEWFSSSWDFAKKILPLLLFGVLIAGALLGRVGHEGIIPSQWVASMVGGNSLWANFFASFAGAFMYFATLTEVPILQGLIGSGMGKGPALALLLAGPALSLPNMLVIRSIMGTKKTVVFVSLVIVMSTFTGMIYGYFFG